MTEPTAAPSGPTNDMRELYALQHAIADAGGAMAPGVHKAIDALREVWDRELRRAQAEAYQYRTALQGAAHAAVPAGQAPATDQTADGMELDEEYAIDVDAAGRPFARVLFAFPPSVPGEKRIALVHGITSAVDGAEFGAEGNDFGEDEPAVLPASVDRATVLREAEDVLRARAKRMTGEFNDSDVLHEDGPAATVATWKRAADELRRMADESAPAVGAQQPKETQP